MRTKSELLVEEEQQLYLNDKVFGGIVKGAS